MVEPLREFEQIKWRGGMDADPKDNGAQRSELVIEDLQPEEIEEAVALWTAAGLTRPWNDPRADIELALRSPGATVLRAQRQGRLVATAMAGSDGHRGWVYYVAVAKDCRGEGIGTAMMRAAESWLAARGVPKLHLLVRASNPGVVDFYRGLGYETSDTLMMMRWLKTPPG